MNNRFRRIGLAVLIAGILAISFYRATFTNFYYIRYKLVDADRMPDPDGVLRVALASDPEMVQCKVFVLKARNRSSERQTLRFLINQTEVAQASLEPNDSTKLFLKTAPFLLRKENQFEIRTNGTAWSVEDWELRNIFKFYRGLITWIVIDRDFQEYESISSVSALLFFLFFFIAFTQWSARAGFRYFLLFVILLLAALVGLSYLSEYRVLISIKSFFFIVFILLFPVLKRLYRQIQTKDGGRAETVRIAVVVSCVFLFFFLSMRYTLWEFKGNYSGFILLSEKYLKKNPYLRRNEVLKSALILREEEGYDAQFYYNMAFDPWLTYYREKPNKYRNIFDVPVFRYRRIGYPALTKLFSLNRPGSYAQTMILLLVFSHAAGALFIAKIALHFKKSVWWTLLYVLVPGFTVSLRYGLPESIAAALLIGGIYFYLKRRLLLTLLFFSASLLTRETGALFIAVVILFELFQKRNRRGAILVASAFVPYFLWRAYVTWRLSLDSGWVGFFYEPGNFTAPFFGIGQLWYRVFSGQPTLDGTATSIFFPLVLILIFASSIWMLRRRRDFLTVSLVLYSALAVSLDYNKVWVGVVNAERHTYESFVLLLVIFLSMKEEVGLIRFLPFFVFILVFVYNWCCLTTGPTFHAGLLFLN